MEVGDLGHAHGAQGGTLSLETLSCLDGGSFDDLVKR